MVDYLHREHRYPQEQQLLAAYKSLYRYGNRPYTGPAKSAFEGAGEGIGGFAGNAITNTRLMQDERNKKAAAALAARNAEHEKYQKQVDQDFGEDVYAGREKQAVMGGHEMPNQARFFEDPFEVAAPVGKPPENPYEVAQAQGDANEAAKYAPINGQYSFHGLEEARKNAIINGNDRVKMRQLINQGSSMPQELVPGAGY